MFVSRSKYNAMEQRALNAEARVADFEAAQEAEAARQLAAANRKKSKKAAQTTATETTQVDVTALFARGANGKLAGGKEATTARADYVKNAVAGGASVADVVAETGLAESTVRDYLKK